jgi:hypothetical protein
MILVSLVAYTRRHMIAKMADHEKGTTGATVSTIVADVERLLETPRGRKKVEQLKGHLDRVHASHDLLREQVARLGKRSGIAFYSRVGALKSDRLQVDVRIDGMSCGEVELVPGRDERLFVPRNWKISFGGKRRDWKHPQVGEYLKKARSLVQGRLREATVESALLVEMSKRRSKGKPVPLLWHQPVRLAGLPFQFPLPISARGELQLPEGNTAGHADIVARAGHGGRTRLRVFEVKAWNALDIGHALEQAVAYCAALEYLLARFPAAYFSVFGFGGVPRKVTLDAVAFIPDTQAARRIARVAANRLAGGGTHFGLSSQFFRWDGQDDSRSLVVVDEERHA